MYNFNFNILNTYNNLERFVKLKYKKLSTAV